MKLFVLLWSCMIFVCCGYPETDDVSSQMESDEPSNETKNTVSEEEEDETEITEDSCTYQDSSIGDICEESCDEDSVCGTIVYPEEREYVESYCYPICDKSYGDSECMCDDVCVDIDNETETSLCLGSGILNTDGLELRLMDVGIENGEKNIVAINDSQINAHIGNREIEFGSAYGWLLYGDLFGQGDEYAKKWGAVAMYAPKDVNNAWILEIYLNEDILKREGVYKSSRKYTDIDIEDEILDGGIVDDAGVAGNETVEIEPTINWYAQLLSFEDIDDEGRPGRVYSEGKLSDRDENVVEIKKVGSPCPEKGSCDSYQLSFDLEFYEIRARIEYK